MSPKQQVGHNPAGIASPGLCWPKEDVLTIAPPRVTHRHPSTKNGKCDHLSSKCIWTLLGNHGGFRTDTPGKSPRACPWGRRVFSSPANPCRVRKLTPSLCSCLRDLHEERCPSPSAHPPVRRGCRSHAAPTLACGSGGGWRGASGRRTWTTRLPCATRRRRS